MWVWVVEGWVPWGGGGGFSRVESIDQLINTRIQSLDQSS